jgi:hypothetical protein
MVTVFSPAYTLFADPLGVDPFLVAVIDGDESLIFPFMKAHVAAAAIDGEIWVASHDGTDIAGAATWFQPGRKFLDRCVMSVLLYPPESPITFVQRGATQSRFRRLGSSIRT